MGQDDITHVINGRVSGPDADKAMSEIYDQLRACVQHILAGEHGKGGGPNCRQDLTMVVHECWLKLQRTKSWDNRAHFFGAASRATRQILIDMARKRNRRPNNTAYHLIPEPGCAGAGKDDITETAARIDAALVALAEISPRAARVGSYRLFGDLSTEIIAEIEQVNARTVQRDWNFCRVWLASRLHTPDSPPTPIRLMSPIPASNA